MMQSNTFIGYLKIEQPKLWETIREAAAEGLIIVDEASDGVTATNRLLLIYPDLHSVLNLIVDNWIKRRTEDLAKESLTFILNEAQNSHG